MLIEIPQNNQTSVILGGRLHNVELALVFNGPCRWPHYIENEKRKFYNPRTNTNKTLKLDASFCWKHEIKNMRLTNYKRMSPAAVYNIENC